MIVCKRHIFRGQFFPICKCHVIPDRHRPCQTVLADFIIDSKIFSDLQVFCCSRQCALDQRFVGMFPGTPAICRIESRLRLRCLRQSSRPLNLCFPCQMFLSCLLRYCVLFPQPAARLPVIPIKQTAYSAADIVSHLLEHYLAITCPSPPITDHFLPGRHPFHHGLYGPPAEGSPGPGGQGPDDVAASFAWNGFYDCGFGLPNSNIHILGHSLSNFYDTPHGAAMSITILATMRYYFDQRTKKYADFAREVFQIQEPDDRKAPRPASTAWKPGLRKSALPPLWRRPVLPIPTPSIKWRPTRCRRPSPGAKRNLRLYRAGHERTIRALQMSRRKEEEK